MKGHFYRRGCTCKKKRCTCGSTWSFVIDIGRDPSTGKRKQKTKGGFRTKQEAETAATELIYELNQGTYVQEQNVVFKDFASEWLHMYSEKNSVKPGTIRIRQHEINKLLPYFSLLKLKEITLKRYQGALNDLKQKGYADNTLDGVHRTGRMIFKKAIEMRLIKNDPTEFAYLKKDRKTVEELEEKEIPKYMEKEELALLLQTAAQKGLDLDYLIFLTLSYTGMRVGELVALKWKDIDFEGHTISITKTYYNPTNNTLEYQLVPPKTRKSKRKIVVDKEVIDALKKHMLEQQKVLKDFSEVYLDEGFIFAKKDKQPGYPIFIKTVANRMARLLKLAGLNQELTPHSLRHTHTSLLAEAKVGLEEIMDRLGHSDDDTTKNVYLHVTKEMKKEASHKFAQLMRNL
ncbi:tyrosine-type recombinase/integrase [Rossellomorea vietnamensis]|uniref:Tyrosine-type recombinase/integrase n=1 Tax=Rossellomorea vietnamensis TaxID=218284 RepID=A0A6I6UB35_9BACI|nr:tyrosine-type recombinase/integrase [Rossellomorea vietnamensis]QHE59915.1 tyrosine-type recombinase/integrase [Rossellomorea vietnamensis]